MNLHVHIPHADTPRKQLAVILGKVLLIVTVVALVVASISARHFEHTICENQNAAFSAVDDVINHGVMVTQQKLKADEAAHRGKLVLIDERSLVSSRVLLLKIRTIHC
jgi:thiol:disulfide interchange protein